MVIFIINYLGIMYMVNLLYFEIYYFVFSLLPVVYVCNIYMYICIYVYTYMFVYIIDI